MGNCVDGDIIRVTAKMSANSGVDLFQNVYHLLFAGSPAEDNIVHDAIALVLDDAYSYPENGWPTTIDADSISSWNLTQDRPMIEAAWPSFGGGTGAGDSVPYQCAPLVLFETDTARSQGRKYLPPVTEALQTNGVLSSAMTDQLVFFAAEFLGGVIGSGWSALFGNWNPDLARFATWTDALIKSIIRTQRRRVPGVG